MYRLLVGLFLIGVTIGYPQTAPRQACWSLRPSHNHRAQTSTPPYQVNVPSHYEPDKEIEVSISSPSGKMFRGFIVEARNQNGDTVGTFRVSDSATRVNCDKQALTHNSASDKRQIKGFWLAPSTAVGPIVFRSSVVQTFSLFWVGVTSSSVTPRS